MRGCIVEQLRAKAKRVLKVPALGHVHQNGAALAAAVPGGHGLDVHPKRCALDWTKRHLEDFFGLGGEDLLHEGGEVGARLRRDEKAEVRPDQSSALSSQQARPSEIHLPDGSVPIQGHVPHRREVVEVGVAFEPQLQLCPRGLQLVVLQLKLDLVNLQLLYEAQRLFSRIVARGL